jgi:hypothetical protein
LTCVRNSFFMVIRRLLVNSTCKHECCSAKHEAKKYNVLQNGQTQTRKMIQKCSAGHTTTT